MCCVCVCWVGQSDEGWIVRRPSHQRAAGLFGSLTVTGLWVWMNNRILGWSIHWRKHVRFCLQMKHGVGMITIIIQSSSQPPEWVFPHTHKKYSLILKWRCCCLSNSNPIMPRFSRYLQGRVESFLEYSFLRSEICALNLEIHSHLLAVISKTLNYKFEQLNQK